MRQSTLIFGLITAILLAIFALQNSVSVRVKLWFWEFESSLALVLLIALAGGAILGIIFSLPNRQSEKKDRQPKKMEEPSETEQKIKEE